MNIEVKKIKYFLHTKLNFEFLFGMCKVASRIDIGQHSITSYYY